MTNIIFCVTRTHIHTLQVHRACMLATLFIGVIGVAMVFIGHAHENNPRGLIHLGTHHVRSCAFQYYFHKLLLFYSILLACYYCPFYYWTHYCSASNHKCKYIVIESTEL